MLAGSLGALAGFVIGPKVGIGRDGGAVVGALLVTATSQLFRRYLNNARVKEIGLRYFRESEKATPSPEVNAEQEFLRGMNDEFRKYLAIALAWSVLFAGVGAAGGLALGGLSATVPLAKVALVAGALLGLGEPLGDMVAFDDGRGAFIVSWALTCKGDFLWTPLLCGFLSWLIVGQLVLGTFGKVKFRQPGEPLTKGPTIERE